MENLLLKYMRERLEKDVKVKKDEKEPGPVITISRQTGCSANWLAQNLAEAINQKLKASGKDIQWKYINKELIKKSAEELNMDPSKVFKNISIEGKSLIEDFVDFFSSKFYPSDLKIKNKYADAIKSFAGFGNVIIVGRGSEVLTHDIKKSLHIKLFAPMDHRVRMISEKKNMSLEEAEEYIIDIDKNREQFRNYYAKEKPDSDFFDVGFNTKNMNCNEIIEVIMKIIDIKKLI